MMEPVQYIMRLRSVMTDPAALGLPAVAPIIASVMATKLPANVDKANSMTIRTSEDVVDAVSDIADVTVNEVATVLLYLGYRTAMVGGRLIWLVEDLQEPTGISED